MQDSKVLIISQFKETDINQNDTYFAFSFKQTIIIIKQTLNKIINTLLSNAPKLNNILHIFTLSNTKEIDDTFQEEISNFMKNFRITKKSMPNTNQVANIILTYIAGYLIKQGYSKLRSSNNFDLNHPTSYTLDYFGFKNYLVLFLFFVDD